LQLYREKNNWNKDGRYKVNCILGFFCYMYKNHYKTDYVFVPKNPNPYGAKECKDCWQLLAAFNDDANLVRKYIHWIFKKAIKDTTDITSLGYLTTPALIRKFNLYVQRKNTFTRASQLPDGFIKWCKYNAPGIFNKYTLNTFNDLGALLQHIRFYQINNSVETQVIKAAEDFKLIINKEINIRS